MGRVKTEEQKTELRRKAEELLRKKDYRHAKYLYDDLSDVGMSCFCNYCYQLKTKFEAFLFKEITEQQLRKCISGYSKDIVKEVETIYGSVDDILFRERREAAENRLLYDKNKTFDSFLDVFEIVRMEESKGLIYLDRAPYSRELGIVLKSNSFDLNFIKKILNSYDIGDDGDVYFSYLDVIDSYIRSNIKFFTEEELNQIVFLDEYIKNLYKDICEKEHVSLEDIEEQDKSYEDFSYKSLVDKEKERRKQN